MVEKLNPFIERLNACGDAHWDFAASMFLQVSVLVAVLLCLDQLLRYRVRAVFRYAMWTLVLVKLVLPVSLYCPVSAGYWLAWSRPAVLDTEVDAHLAASAIVPAATPDEVNWPFDPMWAGETGIAPETIQATLDADRTTGIVESFAKSETARRTGKLPAGGASDSLFLQSGRLDRQRHAKTFERRSGRRGRVGITPSGEGGVHRHASGRRVGATAAPAIGSTGSKRPANTVFGSSRNAGSELSTPASHRALI